MPILEVEIVVRPGEQLPGRLTADIAERAAKVLRTQPGRTWVRLRTLTPNGYAEDALEPPSTVYPVFVSVLKADVPAANELAAEIADLTQVIATVCDRPSQNVHIKYEPSGRGRMAFGGRLV